MNLIVARFRNVPILAEETAHVAARRPHAEHTGSRQKMIQRFFLDWIDLQRGRRTVTQTIKLSAAIHANKAKSRLSFMNVAMARAKKTVNSLPCFGFPPTPFVEQFGIGKDLKLAHFGRLA